VSQELLPLHLYAKPPESTKKSIMNRVKSHSYTLGSVLYRFYIIALAFIIFDVELVMLFPWQWYLKISVVCILGSVVFASILALGLAYDWAKGLLTGKTYSARFLFYQTL